jgi:hypothetical protein
LGSIAVTSVPLHKQNIQGHIKNIHVLKRKSNFRNIEKELKYLLHKYNGLLKMLMVIKIKSATPLLNFQNPQSQHKKLSRNFNILESGIDFSLPFKCQNFNSVPR